MHANAGSCGASDRTCETAEAAGAEYEQRDDRCGEGDEHKHDVLAHHGSDVAGGEALPEKPTVTSIRNGRIGPQRSR